MAAGRVIVNIVAQEDFCDGSWPLCPSHPPLGLLTLLLMAIKAQHSKKEIAFRLEQIPYLFHFLSKLDSKLSNLIFPNILLWRKLDKIFIYPRFCINTKGGLVLKLG